MPLRKITDTLQITEMSVEILGVVADFVGIFLWAIGFWHFCIAVTAVLLGARKMAFHLVWWALVFSNVGFTIVTIKFGEALKSDDDLGYDHLFICIGQSYPSGVDEADTDTG